MSTLVICDVLLYVLLSVCQLVVLRSGLTTIVIRTAIIIIIIIIIVVVVVHCPTKVILISQMVVPSQKLSY